MGELARLQDDILPKAATRAVLAVVDAGGNTVKGEFRFADDPLKKSDLLPAKISRACRLAHDLGHNQPLAEDAKTATLETLGQINERIKTLEAEGYEVLVRAVGTAPFRYARDGKAFAQRIRDETAIPIEIIDGNREAELAAKGVLAFYPDISGVIADTGGGSTEFVVVENGEILATASLPLGMIPIGEAKHPKKYIREQLQKLPDIFRGQDNLIITGGIHRTLSKAFPKPAGGMLCNAQPYTVPSALFNEYADMLSDRSEALLKFAFNISADRAAQLNSEHLLLDLMTENLKTQNTVLNKASLRDGVRAEMIEELHARAAKPAVEADMPMAVNG